MATATSTLRAPVRPCAPPSSASTVSGRLPVKCSRSTATDSRLSAQTMTSSSGSVSTASVSQRRAAGSTRSLATWMQRTPAATATRSWG